MLDVAIFLVKHTQGPNTVRPNWPEQLFWLWHFTQDPVYKTNHRTGHELMALYIQRELETVEDEAEAEAAADAEAFGF